MYEMDQYTVSLLHFDDGIKDESGKVWTANGGAATSTDQSKMGSKSLYLAGNQYLSTSNTTDFDFGAGDFTIDWWEYRTAAPTGYGAVFCRGNATPKSPYLITTVSTNVMFSGSSNSSIMRNADYDIALLKTFGTYDLNKWNHFAVCRKDTNFYLFKNGVLQTTFTNAGAFAVMDSTPLIGRDRDSDGYFIGYIDEFRVSKGIARWTSDFTLPGGTTLNAPTNLTATAGDSQVALSWTAVNGATGYNVKRSTTAGGPYTTIASNVSGTTYVDTSVTNGTTYYYVVATVNADGESGNSNEISATPAKQVTPPTTETQLLQVTVSDSSDHDYQLSSTEIDSFVNWFMKHASTDTAGYMLNKKVGTQESKEYLAFEKIISFEVMQITR